MEDDSSLERPKSFGRQVSFAASATIAMCNRLLEEHDLSLPQWVVLAALWQTSPLTVSQIAKYSGTLPPATSRILDRMIEKGLVERSASSRDRRSAQIGLTKKGESLRHLSSFHDVVNARITAGMSREEVDLLERLLDKVEQNCKRGTD